MHILLGITSVDIGRLPLDLEFPSLSRSGGYRIPNPIIKGEYLPAYSPIDIAVCGLTALYFKEQSVISLNDWFINNEKPLGELWVTCTISTLTDNYKIMKIETNNIITWKQLSFHNKKLLTLFKKNAPFTFRNIS